MLSNRLWQKILITVLASVAIFAGQAVTINLFPFPLSQLNVIVLFLSIHIYKINSGKVVWPAFLVYFIFDCLSPENFGTALFSGTMSILITYWFMQIIFTNREWYAAFFIALIIITIYIVFGFAIAVTFGEIDGTINLFAINFVKNQFASAIVTASAAALAAFVMELFGAKKQRVNKISWIK